MAIYEFAKPIELNGDQLQAEIGATNLYAIDNKLVIESNLTEKQVNDFVKAHKPIPKPELTIQEKLANANISLDELKTALGL